VVLEAGWSLSEEYVGSEICDDGGRDFVQMLEEVSEAVSSEAGRVKTRSAKRRLETTSP
jgi:hypothetical protein